MTMHNIFKMKRIGYYQWPLTLDVLVRSGPFKATSHLTISLRGQRATRKIQGIITITGVAVLL